MESQIQSINKQSDREVTSSVVEHQVTITASDGYRLGASVFESVRGDGVPFTSRSTVIMNAALAVSQKFYKRFAHSLAGRGHRVVTYDYRGIGRSRGTHARNLGVRLSDWGEKDFDAVLRYCSEEVPFRPIVVMGHSIGAPVIGLSNHVDKIRAVIGVAGQLADYRNYPLDVQVKQLAMFNGLLVPIAKVLGYVPGSLGLGEDLPASIAIDWRNTAMTQGYFYGGINGQDRRKRCSEMTATVLALSIEGDDYASVVSVDAWASLFTNSHRRRVHIKDKAVGHFGFFREEHARHWPVVWNFIEQNISSST